GQRAPAPDEAHPGAPRAPVRWNAGAGVPAPRGSERVREHRRRLPDLGDLGPREDSRPDRAAPRPDGNSRQGEALSRRPLRRREAARGARARDGAPPADPDRRRADRKPRPRGGGTDLRTPP